MEQRGSKYDEVSNVHRGRKDVFPNSWNRGVENKDRDQNEDRRQQHHPFGIIRFPFQNCENPNEGDEQNGDAKHGDEGLIVFGERFEEFRRGLS